MKNMKIDIVYVRIFILLHYSFSVSWNICLKIGLTQYSPKSNILPNLFGLFLLPFDPTQKWI